MHRVVSDQLYSGTDHLFKSEVARKAYLKFINVRGSSWKENSIPSLIRSGAIITDAAKVFALNLVLYLSADNVMEHTRTLDSLSLQSVTGSSTRGRTIFQESSRRTKSLMSVAAANPPFSLPFFLLCKRFAITRRW